MNRLMGLHILVCRGPLWVDRWTSLLTKHYRNSLAPEVARPPNSASIGPLAFQVQLRDEITDCWPIITALSFYGSKCRVSWLPFENAEQRVHSQHAGHMAALADQS